MTDKERIKRLRDLCCELATYLPDAYIPGTDDPRYGYAWDELSSDEQDEVKSVRQRARLILDTTR